VTDPTPTRWIPPTRRPPRTGRDLFSKFDALIAERQALLDTGVRDPFAIVMDEVHSPTLAIIQGKETILLGTYNYMGMTFDPDVIEAGKKALDEFGSGTTGSRVLNGTYQGHKECEEALKDFTAPNTRWSSRPATRPISA
jgi:8-amino-7-oxononanoate synthase